MSQSRVVETETLLAEPRAEPTAVIPVVPAEPATARALWPTFMRRTLAEDTLRPPSPRR